MVGAFVCHSAALSLLFSFELECASFPLALCSWVRVLAWWLARGAKRYAIHRSNEVLRVSHRCLPFGCVMLDVLCVGMDL